MVQVAHLAAILNITVLLLASISNRVAARIIKSFATTRLNTERRTPIIHDSDLWLPRIPITIYLYRRHPGTLSSSPSPSPVLALPVHARASPRMPY